MEQKALDWLNGLNNSSKTEIAFNNNAFVKYSEEIHNGLISRNSVPDLWWNGLSQKDKTAKYHLNKHSF